MRARKVHAERGTDQVTSRWNQSRVEVKVEEIMQKRGNVVYAKDQVTIRGCS